MVALLPAAHYPLRQLGPVSALHPHRCEYTSKRCENARAIKPNGDRHRLCEHHRLLANKNQRRWQHRRKQHLRHEQTRVQEEPAMRVLQIQAPTSQQWGLPDAPIPPRTWPVDPSPSPTVLPRLRHHHVLSRALLQPPVSPLESPLTQYLSHGHEGLREIQLGPRDEQHEPIASFCIELRRPSGSYQKAMFQRS